MSNDKTLNICAKIIAETSAGMTALEIYQDDNLVWSHDYFANGATQDWYKRGMRQIIDDAHACADWGDYEGCDLDDDGEVVSQDCAATTYVLMTFVPGEGWTTGLDHLADGQASDLIRTNRDRLPAEIIALIADED